MNKVEGSKLLEGEDTLDKWGGGDTIGGSPRVRGSRITPEEIGEIIETCVK